MERLPVLQDESFLATKNNIALMMNIDWFQPYKHRTYAVGVIYLVIMDLPREIRFKRDNSIIIGVIPGPSEPPKTINTYLTPLVTDLLSLWKGLPFKTPTSTVEIRCALLCVACDLPAGRKVCGFLSFVADLGCSRCYCNFGTGIFGRRDYSGFDRQSWKYRSNSKHRSDVQLTLSCSSKTAREKKESEVGCRYSCLLQLPYFDAVRMMIVDPMHNLYLGTAKRMFRTIWIKNFLTDQLTLGKVNSRISSLDVPSNVPFHRLPPSIEATCLTAEQWMIWVNYYSIYCLHDVLPPEHLECWRHFVLASRLLSKYVISKDDVKVADALLLQFCRHFQSLYGSEAVTPNIHLHNHLADCIRDFGPLASFWLFSFERFNGLLGDVPTNNRAIEVQLMQRFLDDNSHLQLLSCIPSGHSEVDSLFRGVVVDHAQSFQSVRHIDTMSTSPSTLTSGIQCVQACKYTMGLFSQSQLEILSQVLCSMYKCSPDVMVDIPQSYRKMSYLTVSNQRYMAGQYILARSMFNFETKPSVGVTRTVFTDPALRPAKVDHFAM